MYGFTHCGSSKATAEAIVAFVVPCLQLLFLCHRSRAFWLFIYMSNVAMETLTPMLHAFYTQSLSTESRSNIHLALLSSLSDPIHQKGAIDYLTDITSNARPVDPYVLHHALHTIETLARTSFSTIPPADRDALQSLLLNFLTNSHARHLSDLPSTHHVPPHALNKAAAALVSLGKRHWLTGAPDFPNALLRLVDSPAHTPRSLASLLAGHAILTTLLDDVMSMRRDLRARDAALLRRLVASQATHFLSALEIALRAAGPRFPSHIAPTAARAVATLSRIEPSVASHAIAILARSAHNRFDTVAALILTSVADILSSNARVNCAPVVETVAAALEAIATGTPFSDVQVASSLLAVVDALVTRLVAPGALPHGLDSILNGLMGITMRWAAYTPHWLPCALDTWIAVLEAFDDADKRDDAILQRVYESVAKLCAERAFYVTNADVLRKLGQPSISKTEQPYRVGKDTLSPRDWGAVPDKMADVAIYPNGPGAPALFFDNAGDVNVIRENDDDDEVDDGGDAEGWDGCSVAVYCAKCVETLSVVSQMSSQRARDIAILVVRILSQGGQQDAEHLSDIYTVLSLAYGLAGVLPMDSPEARTICETVCNSLGAGVWRFGRVGVMAVRATVAFVPCVLQVEGKGAGSGSSKTVVSEGGVQIVTKLYGIVKEILAWDSCSDRLATASALLSVSMDSCCRAILYSLAPPIDAATIATTRFIGVASLGVATMARWAVVPGRDRNGVRVRWTVAEWKGRESSLAQMCATVFANLAQAGSLGTGVVASMDGVTAVARQASLLRTLLLAVQGVHGETAEAVWNAVGRNGGLQLIRVIDGLVRGVLGGGLDDDAKQTCGVVIAGALHAIGSIPDTCGRQVVRDANGLTRQAVTSALPMTRAGVVPGGVQVAQAIMRLIRDRLAAGEADVIVAGFDVATSTLDSGADGDVCEVAVSLLSEGLKRHWRTFWPGDVAMAMVANGSENAGAGQNGVATVQADESVSRAYFKALGGLISAMRSTQLGVCRCALLALQQLDASRKLYQRREAFRMTGAARAVVVECVRILGGGGDASRESLGDEAVEVLWGVAKTELNGFVNGMGDVIKEIMGAVDDAVVQSLVGLFEGVEDRGTFSRTTRSLANDMVFYSKLEPSL